VLLGSLTIPGEPVRVGEARRFATGILGAGHPCSDTAVLLTSELVTNSVQHSNSGRPCGAVTLTVISIPGGIRVEVIDDGAEATPTASADPHRQPDLADRGRGLELVEMLSARWSHYSDSAGRVTWFELTESPG
jgi:anti-sigma regulatory factor (Ser/Thr protein kinase)